MRLSERCADRQRRAEAARTQAVESEALMAQAQNVLEIHAQGAQDDDAGDALRVNPLSQAIAQMARKKQEIAAAEARKAIQSQEASKLAEAEAKDAARYDTLAALRRCPPVESHVPGRCAAVRCARLGSRAAWSKRSVQSAKKQRSDRASTPGCWRGWSTDSVWALPGGCVGENPFSTAFAF